MTGKFDDLIEVKHTVEPWEVDDTYITNGALEIIASCENDSGGGFGLDRANARRITACVNACTGISTANLESNLPIKELAHRYNESIKLNEKLNAENAALEKQRDQLLVALFDITKIVPPLMHDENQCEVLAYPVDHNPRKIAMLAIRSAEGGEE